MVIQLTRTKTITIGGGGGGEKKSGRRSKDVVGIDMFGGDGRGFPAVRLAIRKGQIRVLAAGFIPAPDGKLPESWEEAAKNPAWSLPSEFQAPHAAFAVTSPSVFLSQTTLDAVRSDVTSGAHKGDEPSSAPPARRFGIRREVKKAEEPKPEAAEAEPRAIAAEIRPGVPVSNGGTRFVMRPMAGNDGFVMEAGIPEYQALWLSRLLPEGRRPTVASIQPRASANTASILGDPEFLKAGGTGLAIFIGDEDVTIAGFKNHDIVLWRRSQAASGYQAIRKALIDGLGVGEDMLDGILNDNLIDPRPVLEGVLIPLMDELAVSRDYLAGKLGVEPRTVFTVGLPSGIVYWNAIAQDRARLTLTECRPFAGFEGALPEAKDAGSFSGALGAALALMAEDD